MLVPVSVRWLSSRHTYCDVSVAASWTNYLLVSYASERGAVRYIARLGALALVPGVATIGFVLSYLKW